MPVNENTKATKAKASTGWTRGIVMLLWKNLQYRKRCRGCCYTGCEIFLPFVIVLVQAITSTRISNTKSNDKDFTNNQQVSTNIKKLGETFNPCKPASCEYFVAFYPTEAQQVIDDLVKKLKSVTEKTDSGGRRVILKFTTKPYNSEEELETFVTGTLVENNHKRNRASLHYVVSVIFTKGFKPGKTDVNPEISYTIRLPVDKHKEIETHELYHSFGLSEMLLRTDRTTDWYERSGFTLVQLVLDNILIQQTTKSKTIPNVIIEEFPKQDTTPGLSFLASSDGFLIFAFVFMIHSITQSVVPEKKSGIKELMKIMGLPNWIHWLGWMLSSMILYLIVVTLLVIVLCYISSGSKALLGYSNIFIVWISLYLYVMSAIAFCLFVCSLFQRPTLALWIGNLLWTVTYLVPSLLVDPNDHENFRIEEILALALLPNYAIHLLLTMTFRYEKQAIGSQWNNIAEPMNSEMPLRVIYIWFMFLLDTMVYSLLAVYLENVLPSEFGIRKPWYYPFLSPCCNKVRLPSRRKKRAVQVEHVINAEPENTTGFEAEPTGLHTGIIITNLSKQFGRKKKAVNNLSFKMFDGQITALLGHNGAGKTTTMSILTGIFSPTSGTATVNGFDIRTQMDKVRNSLGLCPQHNLLFEQLNVREHLIFFGRLKGLSWDEAKKETSSLLQLVGMPEKANAFAKKLSGGQKRKLCLCMALVGGAKVLILDEPTSGMDPDARRAIWDVLLTMRESRTILLSTHFMDEADVLGDRIAIMVAGKLQCCGSPEYLKRFYGTGFTLSMTIDPNADKNAIMALVQKHSAEATWKYKKFATDSELGINLPSKEKKGSKSEFAPLLSDLTKKKQELGVQSIGLTMTTMDDVFVKVGELLEGEDAENYEAFAVQTGGESAPKSKGCCLALLRFWALFLKRVLYAWRKKSVVVAQIVAPVLLLFIPILIANSKSFDRISPPKLTMKLSDYQTPKVLYSPDNGLGNSYKDVVNPFGQLVSNITQGLLDAQAKGGTTFQANYIVAADMNQKPDPTLTPESPVTALYSTYALHAIPLSINLVSNAILRSHKADGFIEVSNQPFEDHIRVMIDRSDVISFDRLVSGFSGIFPLLGFVLFAGFLVLFPIEEKTCKELQLMSGVHPLIFLCSSFLWDIIVVLTTAGLAVVALSFHGRELFTAYDAGGVIFLILLVFGVTLIPFAYVCSHFFKIPYKGFSYITSLGLLVANVTRIDDFLKAFSPNFILVIFRILLSPFPSFAFAQTIPKYIQIARSNAACNFIPEKFQKSICELARGTNEPLYRELYHCCYSCDKNLLNSTYGNCHKPLPFLNWNQPLMEYEETTMPGKGGTSTTKPMPAQGDTGILQDLLYVSLVGLFYTILLLLLEFGILGRLMSKSEQEQHNRPSTDDDVKVESQRVKQMIASGQVGQDAFVADDISKSYGGFAAVSNLSFGVHHGECFGLLGVNGAGKTTAFKILTGQERSSGGNAYAFEFTLRKNRRKFLGNIGYCPQFDAIIEVLTGREMLELFARLKGIQGKYVNDQATMWLKKTGLYASRNQLCKKYSGGMKRRLSAGMALIGEPKIIMLDEPTSGVDPMSRRRFWDVLAEARSKGQSVILTSHSMEECEALCTRLGIMVNGQLQCFGDVEHLKTKFTQGYSLVLKLKPLVPPESPELLVLNTEILTKFDPCELKDQHQNVLQYQISNLAIGLEYIINQMEDIKTRNEELIEDYSVNETTLEDVFLVLARQQYPQRAVASSCMNQCSADCC